MNTVATSGLACSLSLALVAPALAHHSAAAFDTQREVRVTGTITEYTFRNPHVYMILQVKNPDGSVVAMEVEGAPRPCSILWASTGIRSRSATW